MANSVNTNNSILRLEGGRTTTPYPNSEYTSGKTMRVCVDTYVILFPVVHTDKINIFYEIFCKRNFGMIYFNTYWESDHEDIKLHLLWKHN